MLGHQGKLVIDRNCIRVHIRTLVIDLRDERRMQEKSVRASNKGVCLTLLLHETKIKQCSSNSGSRFACSKSRSTRSTTWRIWTNTVTVDPTHGITPTHFHPACSAELEEAPHATWGRPHVTLPRYSLLLLPIRHFASL